MMILLYGSIRSGRGGGGGGTVKVYINVVVVRAFTGVSKVKLLCASLRLPCVS